MIKTTVLTRHGYKKDLYFEEMDNYRSWKRYWELHQDSTRLVAGWEQSIRLCDITRVISVEEEN